MPKKFQASTYPVYFGKEALPLRTCTEALAFLDKEASDFVLVYLRHKFSGDFDDFVDIRNVASTTFNSSVVGIVSLPVDVPVSVNRLVEESMSQLRWAVHAGMYAAILQLSHFEPLCLSAIISRFCAENPPDHSPTRLWIDCTVCEWESWSQTRAMCGFPSNVSVSLRYDPDLFLNDSYVISRWLSEPVSVLRFDGCLSISPDCLHLLRFFQHNVQPIVSNSVVRNELISLLSLAPKLKWEETYVGQYHDTLQIPLQPLADNMDNVVYETFETDQTKYVLYEEAIFRALTKLSFDYPNESLFKLSVVGAGRGGLIDSAIRAMDRLPPNIRIEIYGVEKNPNAARTLQFRVSDEPKWNSENVSVRIVQGDMRKLSCPCGHVDILVSELLGSLGDNEASPECIDGVVHWLHPNRGISIPQKYFSSIEPVSCPKIWSAVRDANKLESPLVVNFHTSFHPAAPLPLFSFVHPSAPTLSMNKTLSWTVPDEDFLLCGFAGYFHADLYGGVTMSTHPPTKTEGMVSWFPAFLPLKTPVLVRAGQTTSVNVDRQTNENQMFIQWTLLEPSVSVTHNPNGAVHVVGL